MNSPVLESRLSQPFHPGRSDARRLPAQLVGKSTESGITRTQPRLTPVPRYLFHEAVCIRVVLDSKVGDLGPEVVSVRVNSIMASVGTRDDDAEQLALPPAQG